MSTLEDSKIKKEKLPRYQLNYPETERKEDLTKIPSPPKPALHAPPPLTKVSQEEELLIAGLDDATETGTHSDNHDQRLQDAKRQIEEYLQVKDKHIEGNPITKVLPQSLFGKQVQKIAETAVEADPIET
jgi:hypothetical protein